MIYASGIYGYGTSVVSDGDRKRAVRAAQAVCDFHGVSAKKAAAAYRDYWLEHDSEDGMDGDAAVWALAINEANLALTSTWANPTADVYCDIEAW